MVYCFDLLDKPNSMVMQISLLTEFDHYPKLESWVLFSRSITILKVRGDLVYEWLIRDMLTKSPIVTGNLLSEDEEGNIPTMPDDPATIFFGWKGDRKATFRVYEAKKTKWNLESPFLFMGQVLIQCAFWPGYFILHKLPVIKLTRVLPWQRKLTFFNHTFFGTFKKYTTMFGPPAYPCLTKTTFIYTKPHSCVFTYWYQGTR